MDTSDTVGPGEYGQSKEDGVDVGEQLEELHQVDQDRADFSDPADDDDECVDGVPDSCLGGCLLYDAEKGVDEQQNCRDAEPGGKRDIKQGFIKGIRDYFREDIRPKATQLKKGEKIKLITVLRGCHSSLSVGGTVYEKIVL